MKHALVIRFSLLCCFNLSPKRNEAPEGPRRMEVTYAAWLFVQILVLLVKQRLVGHDLLGHPRRFPRKLDADLPVVLEQVHLDLVVARLEFHLGALLLHRVKAGVVDDEFTVDPEARTVVALREEG